MTGFLRLVINENMKLYKRKLLWIMLAILVATIVLSLVVVLKTSDDHSEDWKANVKADIQTEQQRIDDKKTPEVLKDQASNQMKINQYRLDHNVAPLENNTAMGFVQSTLGYSALLTLFIIIIAASIVSQEYAWGTIKLVLMRPIQRWKILLSKYVSVIFNALVMFLGLMILSFIIGAIVFGFDDMSMRYVYIQQGEVHDVQIFVHFLQYFGSKFVGLMMIAAFAFMLSTLFKSNALAIALSIVIQYAGSLITNVLSLLGQDYAKYIFFTNTDLYQYVEGNPAVEGMTLGFSIVVLIIYFVVFMGISIYVFQKRDVVS